MLEIAAIWMKIVINNNNNNIDNQNFINNVKTERNEYVLILSILYKSFKLHCCDYSFHILNMGLQHIKIYLFSFLFLIFMYLNIYIFQHLLFYMREML